MSNTIKEHTPENHCIKQWEWLKSKKVWCYINWNQICILKDVFDVWRDTLKAGKERFSFHIVGWKVNLLQQNSKQKANSFGKNRHS